MRIVIASLIAALAAPAFAQQAPAVKIAVIDVQRVLTESAAGKQSFERLKKVRDAKVEEGRKLEKDLRDLEKRISDQKFSLSEDKLNELQKDYQARAIAFKRFQDDADRELEEAQKKELRELEKRIMPVIEAMGKERGYTAIFNKYQSGLVYADSGADVTEAVVKRFDEAAAASTSAPPAPKDGAK